MRNSECVVQPRISCRLSQSHPLMNDHGLLSKMCIQHVLVIRRRSEWLRKFGTPKIIEEVLRLPLLSISDNNPYAESIFVQIFK
jgi:hypothetical protein